MLEKIPHSVGYALRGVRAGFDKVISHDEAFIDVDDLILIESPSFSPGGALPAVYTDDGAKVSPPLRWSGAPAGTQSLVLIVEDPDAPTPGPLTHLIAWTLPADLREIDEGAFQSPGHDLSPAGLGRNSFFQAGWLPPDPPAGHGPHHYVFQLFALDYHLAFDHPPGRHTTVEAMKGHVLAKGMLIGTYERP